jgi:hypothetical protein
MRILNEEEVVEEVGVIITEGGTGVAVEADTIVMVATIHKELAVASMVDVAIVVKDGNTIIILRLNLMVHISQEINGTSYHSKSTMKKCVHVPVTMLMPSSLVIPPLSYQLLLITKT